MICKNLFLSNNPIPFKNHPLPHLHPLPHPGQAHHVLIETQDAKAGLGYPNASLALAIARCGSLKHSEV